MADLSRVEDDNTLSAPVGGEATTGHVSGRPKRAATRTQYSDKDAESKSIPMTNTVSRKGPAKQETNGESGQEKPAKRRKAGPGEKPAKKGRAAQPLAAAPTGSPLKLERDTQFRPSELSKEEMIRVEEASLLAGLQTSYNRSQPEIASTTIAPDGFIQAAPAAETIERSRPTTQTPSQRSSASSYWSVPEQQDFRKFIAHFGTDFGAIAQHMGTKTQTMVSQWLIDYVQQSPLLMSCRSRTFTSEPRRVATVKIS